MKPRKTRISQSFQHWLLVLVTVAFLATTAFLWLIQTRMSENNAISLLTLNLSDVQEDMIDASDEHLLTLTQTIAKEVDGADPVDSALLIALMEKYDVTEINVINETGHITATTYPDFLNYDMSSGAQSAEFMVLLQGKVPMCRATRVYPTTPPSFANTAAWCWKRAALCRWATARSASSGILTHSSSA